MIKIVGITGVFLKRHYITVRSSLATCRVLLTVLRDDPQRDTQAGVFDQLDDVGVWHVDDGLTVHRQDPVAHLQLPAAVGRAALDDAADLVGHSCGEETLSAADRTFFCLFFLPPSLLSVLTPNSHTD